MTKNSKRKIWHQPWGYPEGSLIAFGLLLTGFLLDFSTGQAFPKPPFPWNISLFMLLISVLIVAHLNKNSSPFIRWLSSVPAAISALVLFTFISVLMGLIPQKNLNVPSLSNLLDSWAYFFSYIYLLIVLGLATLKRIWPLKKRNAAYVLNHFGLWLALAAAGLGAGDIQQYNMFLTEGKTTWYGYRGQDETIELPFALRLDDFTLENYPAKIALVDPKTKAILRSAGKPALTDLPLDKPKTLKGFEILATEYLEFAVIDSLSNYIPLTDTGAVQAAKLTVNGDVKGWVSPGNFRFPMRITPISDTLAIAMLKPEAKRYASDVTVFLPDQREYRKVIEVNKPIVVEGWKIYQSDYDERFGRWSRHSILEIVRDPWLPIVYVGFYMMIIGAILLIFQGKKTK
ncbi:MAG: cytochrome c biogenesis protein ResB [Salinivirgaceae bacterium]